MIYSLNEKVVGKWIDNKPLYQKTFLHTGALTSGDNTIDIGDFSDIDVFVYGEALAIGSEDSVDYYKPFNDGGATGTKLTLEFNTDAGLVCNAGANIVGDYDRYLFTIRYTKISDTV